MSLIKRNKLSTNDILNGSRPEYNIDIIKSLITVPFYEKYNNFKLKEENKEEWLQIYLPKSKNNKTNYLILQIDRRYPQNDSYLGISNNIDLNLKKWSDYGFYKKIAITSTDDIKSGKNLDFRENLCITINGFFGNKFDIEGFEFYIHNTNDTNPVKWFINGNTQTIRNCKFLGKKFNEMFLVDGNYIKKTYANFNFDMISKVNYGTIIEKEVDDEYNILNEYDLVRKIVDPDTVITDSALFELNYGILRKNSGNDNSNVKYNDEFYKRRHQVTDGLNKFYKPNNIIAQGNVINERHRK